MATVKQKTVVLGVTEEKETVETNLVSFSVKKVTEEGIVLEQTIVDMANKLVRGKADPMDEQTLAKMKGHKFTITLNARGYITGFQGYESLIKKLSDGEPEIDKLLRAMIPVETFKKLTEQMFSHLPDKQVSQGDTWDRTVTLPLGPIGTLKVKNILKYEGQEKGQDVITAEGKLTYSPPKGGADGLPFKVIRGDMKAEKAKGRILFDRKLGRPTQETASVIIKGSLTMEIADMEVTVDIFMEQSAVTRVLSTKPGPAADKETKEKSENKK